MFEAVNLNDVDPRHSFARQALALMQLGKLEAGANVRVEHDAECGYQSGALCNCRARFEALDGKPLGINLVAGLVKQRASASSSAPRLSGSPRPVQSDPYDGARVRETNPLLADEHRETQRRRMARDPYAGARARAVDPETNPLLTEEQRARARKADPYAGARI